MTEALLLRILYTKMTNKLQEYFEKYGTMTEGWLDKFVTSYSPISNGLSEGMRYSLLCGGKRLRPVLMFASGDIFGIAPSVILPYAASIEMIHTYSLIHDDLPAMDNDDLRRGKPTNHKVYGEAAAILAGDALLTKAFGIIADDAFTGGIDDKIRLEVIKSLSAAAGDMGMVAGQYADIFFENKAVDGAIIEFIHNNKTGALISYSSSLGAILGGNSGDRANLLLYGEMLGLAFQITDDILDITSTAAVMGKSVHKDEKSKKATFPALFGVEKSRKYAEESVEKCFGALSDYKEKADILREIAKFVLKRES